MKKIFHLLMTAIPLNCLAQTMLVFDTSFVNNTSKDFFVKNPSVKKLDFFCNFQSSRYVSVYFKKDKTDSNSLTNYEHYNLNFIGDKYLLEKKYGAINFPEKEIQATIIKKCSPYFYLTLIANPDSVNLKLESRCLTDDDKFFVKVELFGHYKYGMKKLEKEIQSALDKKYFPTKQNVTDSVYLFMGIIDNKDSSLKQVALLDGRASSFTDAIIDELNALSSWIPSIQGSRPVKTYLKIYIRLNKDQSVTVAYPED